MCHGDTCPDNCADIGARGVYGDSVSALAVLGTFAMTRHKDGLKFGISGF